MDLILKKEFPSFEFLVVYIDNYIEHLIRLDSFTFRKT